MIFLVSECYRQRITGILNVDGGHATIFFNELDACIKNVNLKVGFASVLSDFL